MFNISSISVFMIKWWRKLLKFKPSPFLLLFYILCLGVCVFFFRQWTDIPSKKIDIDIYEFEPRNKDTVLVNVVLNLNLYEDKSQITQINPPKSSLIELHLSNPTFRDDSLSHYSLDDFKNHPRLMKAYDKLEKFNSTKDNKTNIENLRNVVGIDIRTEGIYPNFFLLGQGNTTSDTITGIENSFYYLDSLYTDIKTHFFKPEYVSHMSYVCGFKSVMPYDVTYRNSTFSNPISLFKLEDISQQYIKISLNTHNPATYKQATNVQINSAKVNTVGACDIIYKVKGKFFSSNITTESRMDGIDINGDTEEILLYISSKEGASLQSLRMFFLTTVMTVLLTLLLGGLWPVAKKIVSKIMRKHTN